MKWANSWRNFVHNKTDEVPNRVDNRDIHAGNHQLKENLIKDTHYLMIPSNIWTFLIEIYGGGPKIVPTASQTATPKRHHKARAARPNHAAPQMPSRAAQQSPSRGSKAASPHSSARSSPQSPSS